MKYREIGGIKVSRLALGAMRIADKPLANIERLVNTALEIGINTFDHADVYGGGACERMFGALFKNSPSLRNKTVLQTKCGLRGEMRELSYDSIINAVNGSLSRLCTDRIDILILHCFDELAHPQEIARAFDELEKSGKVRAFGVCDHSARQIEYLQRYINQKLCVNQMPIGLTHARALRSDRSPEADTFTFCRDRMIAVQTYGTMQCSFTDETGYFYSGAFTTQTAQKKYFSLLALLDGMAQKYGVTRESAAVAWILKHPSDMQAIVGTTLDTRLAAYKDCCDVPMTNYEWYKIAELSSNN
ncbi:MAG: aldo/keto reductase [Roseburia sp.]|nr:aldo/keto reductase [Roseburia sp.]